MKAKYPRMPVIMPAEAGQVIALYECLQSGLDEHIPKPFLPDRLVDTVKKVVG
jgi:DNA-binding NtrC family response regulator